MQQLRLFISLEPALQVRIPGLNVSAGQISHIASLALRSFSAIRQQTGHQISCSSEAACVMKSGTRLVSSDACISRGEQMAVPNPKGMDD